MPRTATLTADQRAELVRAAELIPAGRRGAFVREQARLLGCHEATVYRVLEQATPTRSRKRRSDAGQIRAADEETFLTLAALTARYDYDAQLAVDTLNANRVREGLAPVDVTPATLRRWLDARDVSRRKNAQDRRVHRSWESPYSNHIHQIDSTVAACYYIDRGDSIGYEGPEARNKNKAGNGLPRVWLIHSIDDHSRVVWARFFTSEAAVCWRELLLRAWAKPADTSTWPAYGMPELVYSDQGSGLKSLEMRRVLDELGVKYRMAEPSTAHETNAQAKGKVERGMQLIANFEKTTRARRFTSLEEMNHYLDLFLLDLNRQRHSVTGQVRFHRWLAGMRGRRVRLLPPPEIVTRMLFVPIERLISKTMQIRLEGRVYQLPHREPFISYARSTVTVRYRPHDLSKIIVVLDREEHEIDAVVAVPDVAGEYKSAPVPAAVELKRELLKHDLSHIDPHLVHEYRVERSAETFAAKLEEDVHPLASAAAEVRMIRRGKAIDRLARAGVIATPPTAAEIAQLDALYAGRPEIPEPDLERWITEQRDGVGPSPRLAVLRA